MDYVSKYNKGTVSAINTDTVSKIHSIYSNKESEANSVYHVSIRQDGYKVIPKPSFDEPIRSD